MEAAGFAGGWWGTWSIGDGMLQCAGAFPAIDLILVTVASSTSSQMEIFRGAVMRQRGSLLFCFHPSVSTILHGTERSECLDPVSGPGAVLFYTCAIEAVSMHFPADRRLKIRSGGWRGVTPPRADEQKPISGGCAADTLDNRPRHHRRLFKLHVTWIRIEDTCD